MPNIFKDLTGQVFGKLTVVEYAGKKYKNGQSQWLCKCECGGSKIILGSSLKDGNTKSCGCLWSEHGRKSIKENRVILHGMSKTPEYETWLQMRKRCTNPKDKYFHIYGAKGISVCDRWINSFENFFEDMGLRPSNKHSLDRYPNNKGNYGPSNCRWATQKEQQNNRTNNRIIDMNGVRKTLSQWSDFTGIPHNTISARIKKQLSIEEALTV